MDWPWEKKAMRGDEMPAGLGLEDQMAYQALRNMHRQYSAGRLSREAAAREKRLLLAEYRKRMDQAKFEARLIRSSSDLWKGIETAVYRYRENPSLEAADRIIDAVYRVGFLKRPGEEKT